MSGQGQGAKPTGDFVAAKIAEFENRIGNLESKAVASFIAADNVVKRNANWLIPVAMVAGAMIDRLFR
jgi:hypothetical protein